MASGSSDDKLDVNSPLMMGHTEARCIGDVFRIMERRRIRTSARVIDEGEDAGVAVSSSTIFSRI